MVKRPILQPRTKFRKDRSNRYGDIAIFVIFKISAATILNFQKFKIFTVAARDCTAYGLRSKSVFS